MPYKIAIASGKGGTGKTTVSLNLFYFLQKKYSNIQLVDCDVEEPNDFIFFKDAEIVKQTTVNQLVPIIDSTKCTYCKKCVSYCEFNAIVIIEPIQFAEVNPDLCHSCGACLVACKDKAITETKKPVGKLTLYDTKLNGSLLEGRLNIGSSMQTMLIRELKKQAEKEQEIIIYDAPPGTSCPVVETISDTDYVVLVTEPTPFGLHDLKLMIELLTSLKKPFGIVVNKAGLGNQKVYEYINENRFTLLSEIPFDETYAARYAQGNLFQDIPLKISNSYYQILANPELIPAK